MRLISPWIYKNHKTSYRRQNTCHVSRDVWISFLAFWQVFHRIKHHPHRVSFVIILSTASLSYSKPAPTRLSCDSCGVQDRDKSKTLYDCFQIKGNNPPLQCGSTTSKLIHMLQAVWMQIRLFVKWHYLTQKETVLDLLTMCHGRAASIPAWYFGAPGLSSWFSEQLLWQILVFYSPSNANHSHSI